MTTQRLEIYKCDVCGLVAQVLDGGAGELVCCGQPMTRFTENTFDAAKEKHVPVATRDGRTLTVHVGSVAHPMEAKHYIQWIEVLAGGRSVRQFLQPGDKPQATFEIEPGPVVVREFCNLHGLWKAENGG